MRLFKITVSSKLDTKWNYKKCWMPAFDVTVQNSGALPCFHSVIQLWEVHNKGNGYVWISCSARQRILLTENVLGRIRIQWLHVRKMVIDKLIFNCRWVSQQNNHWRVGKEKSETIEDATCREKYTEYTCLILSIVFGFEFCEEHSSAHRVKRVDWYILNLYCAPFRFDWRMSVFEFLEF